MAETSSLTLKLTADTDAFTTNVRVATKALTELAEAIGKANEALGTLNAGCTIKVSVDGLDGECEGQH